MNHAITVVVALATLCQVSRADELSISVTVPPGETDPVSYSQSRCADAFYGAPLDAVVRLDGAISVGRAVSKNDNHKDVWYTGSGATATLGARYRLREARCTFATTPTGTTNILRPTSGITLQVYLSGGVGIGGMKIQTSSNETLGVAAGTAGFVGLDLEWTWYKNPLVDGTKRQLTGGLALQYLGGSVSLPRVDGAPNSESGVRLIGLVLQLGLRIE